MARSTHSTRSGSARSAGSAAEQLTLVGPRTSWRMSEETRQLGRAGVAEARRVLAEARARAEAASAPAVPASTAVTDRPAATATPRRRTIRTRAA